MTYGRVAGGLLLTCLFGYSGLIEVTAQSKVGEPKPGQSKTIQPKAQAKPRAASPKPALPKPDLSVDDARMIVKEIPSVDIGATLGRWKLTDPELMQLRQWSGTLVERPGSTEFLPKWNALVAATASRNPQIKEADVTPLIRMVMLAAYEEAQKHAESGGANARQDSNVYKELQEQVRSNITQARQLQALLRPMRRDPLSGSTLGLSAHQRTLRQCDVAGQPQKVECKQVLVATTYELEDYIATSEAQLKKAEEQAKKADGTQAGQDKRREMLYALSDLAKLMHDGAVTAIRK
jgi:hypothetical protein